MSVKVAVAGTHSTGKSTFLNLVSDRLRQCGLSVVRVGDLALQARSLGFPILAAHTFESTLWIMVEGIRRELEAGLASDVVLVDRPVLDALGYLQAALRSRGATLTQEQRRMLRGVVRGHMPSYGMTFVTALDASVPLGDGRDSDAEFRRIVAERIKALARRMACSPVTLRREDVPEAVDAVEAHVLRTLIAVGARTADRPRTMPA